MRVKSLLLCGSGAVAASGLLLGALIFTGPILSGAFFFSSGTHRKPAPHPLPADYPDTGRPTTVTYDRDPRTHFVSGVTVTCAGNGRWRVSHSLPTTPDERDDTKARLLAQWCAPQM